MGSAVPLVAGSASLNTDAFPAGTNIVSAEYLSDGNFVGSSNEILQIVNVQTAPPGPLAIHRNLDGTMTVTFAGTPGVQYSIHASSNLDLPWSVLGSGIAGVDGTVSFTDTNASAFSQRFYRGALP